MDGRYFPPVQQSRSNSQSRWGWAVLCPLLPDSVCCCGAAIVGSGRGERHPGRASVRPGDARCCSPLSFLIHYWPNIPARPCLPTGQVRKRPHSLDHHACSQDAGTSITKGKGKRMDVQPQRTVPTHERTTFCSAALSEMTASLLVMLQYSPWHCWVCMKNIKEENVFS